MTRTEQHPRLARIWGVLWLPLLFGGLALVLAPFVDEFLLELLLLALALAIAGRPDS
jgi:hypothetical protein